MSIQPRSILAALAGLVFLGALSFVLLITASKPRGHVGGPSVRAKPGPPAAPRTESPAPEEASERPEIARRENDVGPGKGFAVFVKVIDSETQELIAGASVSLEETPDASSPSTRGRDQLRRAGTTDARGLFEAKGLPEGVYRLSAIAKGYLPPERVDRVSVPTASQDGLTVALEPGSTVSGRVLDASGGPLPGATVRPRVSADTIDQSDPRLSAVLAMSAATDPDG